MPAKSSTTSTCASISRSLHGSELDGRNAAKGDLVAHILATERLDAANTVMIGDRSHDIVGASANGVASIGVLWGYGDWRSLTAAGATADRDEAVGIA